MVRQVLSKPMLVSPPISETIQCGMARLVTAKMSAAKKRAPDIILSLSMVSLMLRKEKNNQSDSEDRKNHQYFSDGRNYQCDSEDSKSDLYDSESEEKTKTFFFFFFFCNIPSRF